MTPLKTATKDKIMRNKINKKRVRYAYLDRCLGKWKKKSYM